MEPILIIGIFLLAFAAIASVIEDAEYMHIIFSCLLASLIFVWILWANVTELTYEPVEIKETSDFIYYIDHKNNIISLPNNTESVSKVVPRKWSSSSVRHEITLK